MYLPSDASVNILLQLASLIEPPPNVNVPLAMPFKKNETLNIPVVASTADILIFNEAEVELALSFAFPVANATVEGAAEST